MDKYILVDGEITKEPNLLKWAKRWEGERGHVALDTVGDARISTVFLGINHRFSDNGPPVLFETMVFGGEHDEYQERYCTIEEARAGHAKALKMVMGE